MLGFKIILFVAMIIGLACPSISLGFTQPSLPATTLESASGFIDHFFFQEIGDFFLEATRWDHWQSLLQTVQTAIFGNLFATVLALMVFLLGVLTYQRLLWHSDRIVKRALRDESISSFDSTQLFLSTVTASILCWSPILAIGCYLNWPFVDFESVEFHQSTDFQQSLGSGLIACYLILVIFRLVQEFFTVGGVSEAIYGLKHSTARYILNRVELTILMIIPLLFLIVFTNSFSNGRWLNSVGRLSFLLTVALSFNQFHKLFWPRSRLYDRLTTVESTAKTICLRNRIALYLIGISVFMLATGLTISGWFSIAKALSVNIALTLLAGVIAFSLRTIVGQKASELIRQAHLIEDLGQSADAAGTVRSQRVQEFVRRYATAAQRAVNFLSVACFAATLYFIWKNWIELPNEWLQIEIGGVALVALIAISKLGGIGLATWYLSRELPAIMMWGFTLQTKTEVSNPALVSKFFAAAIVYVGILIAARSISLELPVIPWLGTLLTISFLYAARDFFGDGFAGLVLLFDPRVKPGDNIEIAGRFGHVESVNLFTTIVEDNLGTRSIVPNSSVIKSPIVKSHDQITVPMLIDVKLPRDADTYQAQALMVLVTRREPEIVVQPPPHVRFVAFQHDELRFQIRLLILATADFSAVKARLEEKLAIEFERHEIQTPTGKYRTVRFPEKMAG